MNDNRAFWIWLQTGLGMSARSDEVTAVFPSPEEMYALGADEWRISGLFTYNQIQRLKSYSPEKASAIIRQCDSNGWQIITVDSPDYPPMLKKIKNFPLVLYSCGDLSCLCGKVAIAVVGSRSASQKSLDVAGRLCCSLAQSGAVVVSGCALGVDSAAHTGALYGNGKTVAVLGCGINVPYLMQNAALRHEISKNGAVISEYPPNAPVTRGSFPARNRIISGLSNGVTIIEAGLKSGSLITAGCAAEQGRDIFAISGDVTSIDFTGVNKLIRDGAKPVYSAADILCEYAELYPDAGLDMTKAQTPLTDIPLSAEAEATHQKAVRTEKKSVADSAPETAAESIASPEKRPLPDSIAPLAKTVYEAFGSEPIYVDELVVLTGVGADKIFAALTELEIYGFIKLSEGKRYILN